MIERRFELINGGVPGAADLTKKGRELDVAERIAHQGDLGAAESLNLVHDMRGEQIKDIRRAIEAATGTLVDAAVAQDIHDTATQLALTPDVQTRRRLLEELKARYPNLITYLSRFESVVRDNKLEE